MHAHDTETRADTKEFTELFQKLLSYAKDMDCADLVEFVKDSGEHSPAHKFEIESVAEEFIQYFENIAFWNELISRLSERDVIKEARVDSTLDIDFEERISALSKAEEKWRKEFVKYDMDRILVNQSFKDVVH